MNFRRALATLHILLLISLRGFSQTGEWKLQKDENGIKIYTRHAEGFAIDELKTESIVKAPVAAVVGVIVDADRYHDWIYACSESHVLQKISDSEQYQYQVNDIPYPLSDRDIVIHLRVWKDSLLNTIRTSSIGEPTYIPPKPGLVRVPVFLAEYEIVPLEGGKVKIIYQLKFDPGGSIPDWVVNLFLVKAPFESTLKMREVMESGKYDNSVFDFLNQ
jgi:hypothetical protein